MDASTPAMIDRANELAKSINGTEHYNRQSVKKFDKLCKYLIARGVDLSSHVTALNI